MQTSENIILQTKRLNMLVPTQKSFDNWYELQSDPDVMKYIDGKPRNLVKVKEGLEFAINHYNKHKFTTFDIHVKETNKFMGKAGLKYLPDNKDIELAYCLHKKYWNKGYATELADFFIKWGFDKFHLNRIVACCEPKNTASSNVMKKCGMEYKGKYLYNGKNEGDIYQINNIVIRTENFYLRPFDEKDDFDLSYNLWQCKDVIKLMECKACSKEDIKEKLKRYKLWMDKFGFTNFAVFDKKSDDFVGSCGMGLFHDPDHDRNPLNVINSEKYLKRDVEIGYVLHKKYWGKGYAKELAKACIDFVFKNNSDIKRIVAATVPSNIASQRVLTKIGFQFVSDINSKEYGKEKFFLLERKLQIRLLQKQDCQQIADSFSKIGWNKSESIYQQYLSEQNKDLRYCYIAQYKGQFAGYVTLLKESKYEYFKKDNICEISDLNILPKFRKKGIATKLIEQCEIEAEKFSNKIGLGVGLTDDYMNAFNLYLKLGYKLDGKGIAYKGKVLNYNNNAKIDDDLNLYLIKKIT